MSATVTAAFPSGPLLDPVTGEVSPAWRGFFVALYNRTGQAQGVSTGATQAALDAETTARIAGDHNLQAQIDSISGSVAAGAANAVVMKSGSSASDSGALVRVTLPTPYTVHTLSFLVDGNPVEPGRGARARPARCDHDLAGHRHAEEVRRFIRHHDPAAWHRLHLVCDGGVMRFVLGNQCDMRWRCGMRKVWKRSRHSIEPRIFTKSSQAVRLVFLNAGSVQQSNKPRLFPIRREGHNGFAGVGYPKSILAIKPWRTVMPEV